MTNQQLTKFINNEIESIRSEIKDLPGSTGFYSDKLYYLQGKLMAYKIILARLSSAKPKPKRRK